MDMRNLLDKLDPKQRDLASKVVEIEKKHNFKARNKYLDQDIVEEIVTVVKRSISEETEAGT